tara:strand:- start:1521 stop:2045 length:525 start_codon:yes stop_codon:yes gene_type:complete
MIGERQRQLSKQRRAFCVNYVRDPECINIASKAARKAGFAKSTCAQATSKFLPDPLVQAYIQELRDEDNDDVPPDNDWIMAQYKKIYNRAMGGTDLQVATKALDSIAKRLPAPAGATPPGADDSSQSKENALGGIVHELGKEGDDAALAAAEQVKEDIDAQENKVVDLADSIAS